MTLKRLAFVSQGLEEPFIGKGNGGGAGVGCGAKMDNAYGALSVCRVWDIQTMMFTAGPEWTVFLWVHQEQRRGDGTGVVFNLNV